MPRVLVYSVWFDGSCEPINPYGNMGMGGYITLSGTRRKHKISTKIKLGEFGYKKTTNNLAEYLALKLCLEYLVEKGAMNVKVYGDSKMVINQMNEVWNIHGGVYETVAYDCKVLRDEIKNISFEWVPRELNTIADKLSK